MVFTPGLTLSGPARFGVRGALPVQGHSWKRYGGRDQRAFTFIGEDEFWNAEIVQIIASGGGHEPLQLAIIPRSGRFTVDLGTMENLVEKLNKLRRFYENGLNNVGWDKYRNISLRYRGQVVCR